MSGTVGKQGKPPSELNGRVQFEFDATATLAVWLLAEMGQPSAEVDLDRRGRDVKVNEWPVRGKRGTGETKPSATHVVDLEENQFALIFAMCHDRFHVIAILATVGDAKQRVRWLKRHESPFDSLQATFDHGLMVIVAQPHDDFARPEHFFGLSLDDIPSARTCQTLASESLAGFRSDQFNGTADIATLHSHDCRHVELQR